MVRINIGKGNIFPNQIKLCCAVVQAMHRAVLFFKKKEFEMQWCIVVLGFTGKSF